MLTSKTYPHGYEDVIADEMVEPNFSQKVLRKMNMVTISIK
jgi:hypothetical protein